MEQLHTVLSIIAWEVGVVALILVIGIYLWRRGK